MRISGQSSPMILGEKKLTVRFTILLLEVDARVYFWSNIRFFREFQLMTSTHNDNYLEPVWIGCFKSLNVRFY